MVKKHRLLIIRYVLGSVILLPGYFVQAQIPVEPTSATDPNVKVHSGERVVLFSSSKRSRNTGGLSTEREGQPLKQKVKAEERATERHGRSIQREKPHRTRHSHGKQARVFKRHNHFAKKEGTRSRSRSTRRPE